MPHHRPLGLVPNQVVDGLSAPIVRLLVLQATVEEGTLMPHPKARLTAPGRRLLADRIRSRWTITDAAGAACISRQTGSKWWCRAQAGVLTDRSSAVHQQARRHPADLVARL